MVLVLRTESELVKVVISRSSCSMDRNRTGSVPLVFHIATDFGFSKRFILIEKGCCLTKHELLWSGDNGATISLRHYSTHHTRYSST